jgi:hypothetical protein
VKLRIGWLLTFLASAFAAEVALAQQTVADTAGASQLIPLRKKP